MRRRWLAWTAGVVAVLALAFAALIFAVPPAPPYDFLSGQVPVKLKRDLFLVEMEKRGISVMVYSFKGDFPRFKRQASKELLAKGFFDIGAQWGTRKDDSTRYVHEADFMRYTPGQTSQPPRMVNLFREMEVVNATVSQLDPSTENTRAGWITVVVIGADEPSWFDNLRSWLGL